MRIPSFWIVELSRILVEIGVLSGIQGSRSKGGNHRLRSKPPAAQRRSVGQLQLDEAMFTDFCARLGHSGVRLEKAIRLQTLERRESRPSQLPSRPIQLGNALSKLESANAPQIKERAKAALRVDSREMNNPSVHANGGHHNVLQSRRIEQKWLPAIDFQTFLDGESVRAGYGQPIAILVAQLAQTRQTGKVDRHFRALETNVVTIAEERQLWLRRIAVNPERSFRK
jgi:hypothetical protein